MAEGTLVAPAPAVFPEAKPFWEGTAKGQLLLPKCNACGTIIWYPRTFCPECTSTDVSWIQASGKGKIYSFTINRRGQADMAEYREAGVYVLAYVELEEGPRIMTNIVDCDPETVKIEQAVQVVFHDTGQGNALPRFKPA